MTEDNDKLIHRAMVLLRAVRFLDYRFSVRESHGGVFLQAHYMEADIYSGVTEQQFTRKWLLAPAMTESEIIQTAFKCCLTSMEHKTREGFSYHGARVFGPHFDVQDMVRLCKSREDAGGRNPMQPEYQPRRIEP